jgi:hypothetical protein
VVVTNIQAADLNHAFFGRCGSGFLGGFLLGSSFFRGSSGGSRTFSGSFECSCFGGGLFLGSGFFCKCNLSFYRYGSDIVALTNGQSRETLANDMWQACNPHSAP